MSWLSQGLNGAKKGLRSIGQLLAGGNQPVPGPGQFYEAGSAPGAPTGAPPGVGSMGMGYNPPPMYGGSPMVPSMPGISTPMVSGGGIGFGEGRGAGRGIGERILGGLKNVGGWVKDNPELATGIAGAGAQAYGAYKQGEAMDDEIAYRRKRDREERERKDRALEEMRKRWGNAGY